LAHGFFAGLPSIGTAGCICWPPFSPEWAGPFLLRSISPRRALRAGRGCDWELPVQFLSWRFAPVHEVVCTGKERRVGDIKKKPAWWKGEKWD